MTEEYCEYDSFDEFVKELNETDKEGVYNNPHLYYNVFQDEEVLSLTESMLVEMARDDGVGSGKLFAVLKMKIDSLILSKSLPAWEEQKKQENKEDVV